jgi:KaiC/GvpD/RAD55 family RecA-like ATPase
MSVRAASLYRRVVRALFQFVRFVRPHILGEFDRAKAVERKDKFAILGTPGVGKSAFGMFLLWKALCAGKTVVYVHGTHRQVYIFHSKWASF